MRVRPDDEVYRINTVWLGPRGLTFPWTARYLAYGVWLMTFLIVLFVEAVTPLSIGIPPVWEICLTTLFTYAVMGLVDHERPVMSVVQTLIAEVSTPRAERGASVLVSSRQLRVVTQRPARAGRRHGGGSAGKRGSRVKRSVSEMAQPGVGGRQGVPGQGARRESVRGQSVQGQDGRGQQGRGPGTSAPGQVTRVATGQGGRGQGARAGSSREQGPRGPAAGAETAGRRRILGQSIPGDPARSQSIRRPDLHNPQGARGQDAGRASRADPRPETNRFAQQLPGQREATARQVARPTAEPLSRSRRDDGDEGTSLNPRGTS